MSAKIGHSLSFPGRFATFWLPAGLAVAAYLSVPSQNWGILLLATFTANLEWNVWLHQKSILVSIGFWIANTTETLCAVMLMRRFNSLSNVLQTVRSALLFALFVCVFSTATGATLGATVVWLAFGENFATTWQVWWSGDFIGMLVTFPFVWVVLESYRSQEFKVFATDVHRTSLETASTAVYPIQSLESVPNDLQANYFTKSNGLCHIRRDVRQKVIFAANDLTSDPPFTRIDLISCRDVLIYLEPKVQKFVLSLFHCGLKTGGTLFLSPSETLNDLAAEFDTVDRHWRIYRKRRDVRLPDAARMLMTPVMSSVVLEKHAFVAPPLKGDRAVWASAAMEDLLAKYVPPSLMINDQHEVLHTFVNARKLLVQPEGRPTMDTLKILGGELRTAVSTALHRAKQEDQPVTLKGIHVGAEESDESEVYEVTVEPYKESSMSLYLICLEKKQSTLVDAGIPENFRPSDGMDKRNSQLERELNYTREPLQATVEELESSTEELQSTNEELHSVNEELYSVNSENHRKITELHELTEDMDNLLSSTDIGIVFMDEDLRIRKFTRAATGYFNLVDHDIGRRLDNFTHNLKIANLNELLHRVIKSDQSYSAQVTNERDEAVLLKILPYVSASDRRGAVLNLVNIHEIGQEETS